MREFIYQIENFLDLSLDSLGGQDFFLSIIRHVRPVYLQGHNNAWDWEDHKKYSGFSDSRSSGIGFCPKLTAQLNVVEITRLL